MILEPRRSWDSAREDLRIRGLVRLAYNLRWTWEPRAAAVFAALARETWQASHNPIAVLHALEAGSAPGLREHAAMIDAAAEELECYLNQRVASAASAFPRIGYFSAEFAVANCLPIYSGGLGVLAGDHLKAASDLGLPIIGIGLLYQYGYFRQRLDLAGRQTEAYERVDPKLLPLRPVLTREHLPCQIRIPLAGRHLYVRAWRADVGRTRLYLLDTNVPQNREDDRWITGHLYGGDHDTRLRQEYVLGVGGGRLLRALHAAGVEACVDRFHLNEGHSAMLVLELARERLEAGCERTFEEALEHIAPSVTFTTHTTEMAGHDVFPAEMMEAYLSEYRRQLSLSDAELMQFGRLNPADTGERFSMTVLALRGAGRRNAVSQLHASISHDNWQQVGIGVRNRPPLVVMDAITNGVHAPTWVGPEMAGLFDSWLGRVWRSAARKPATWAPLEDVPRASLWQARTAQRTRLMERAQIEGDPARMLLVGFARRFATYKRAGLLLQDTERLAQLLRGESRCPLVIIFAGKAHPQDEPAKALIQRIVEASRDPSFSGRLVFLPDYDLELASVLVQGADVWLNTPRRPHEACGTSGMKAAMNGALQLSEVDGWWAEAYSPGLGWALGADLPDNLSDAERDAAEASQLMGLLEEQVVPAFCARDDNNFPRVWLDAVVRSIVSLAPAFSAERMLVDYATRLYVTSGSASHVPRATPEL